MAATTAPKLAGDAAAAVAHRGSHVQIVAAAGSGKTEVVAQRVATLLADGVAPSGIVAFTFTERAAASLKARIVARASEQVGPEILGTIGQLFVGTIHAYCFRLLQQHVPTYETYDVLDPNKLTAFLARVERQVQFRELDPKRRLFASAKALLESADVVENELLDVATLPDPIRGVLGRFYETLDQYRLLTYGRQITHAVAALSTPAVAARIHGELRHLVVDEYQDVNPAQERLIQLMTGPQTHLCVVGDDDQAIYQWRGSDVENILRFADRYREAVTFRLETNYRSRPGIIELANAFAATIPNRQVKSMQAHRPAAGPAVVRWCAETEADEAAAIADAIWRLHQNGVPFRDIAVLSRSRASYPALLEAFETRSIPVQPAGRTGLFDSDEAIVLGKTYCWLAEFGWRRGYDRGEEVDFDELIADYGAVFQLAPSARRAVRDRILQWKQAVADEKQIDLVKDFYELLSDLDCRRWDHSDPMQVNRLGTLARFTTLLADYESVRRRARPDAANPGHQRGGQNWGEWYVRNLAIHITNYASGEFEGFDGEPELDLDAVDLTTIHAAKGLEWPVVFVPSVTGKRFPSSRTGRERSWQIPRELFDAARYEGCDADERRLFYVAATRARDWLSISAHERLTNRVGQSAYMKDVLGDDPYDELVLPVDIATDSGAGDDSVSMTFSELVAFDACGMSYRLRNLLGFEPPLAPELGYGRAVHHVLRTIAEQTRANNAVPDADAVQAVLDANFFLPTANKAAFVQMRAAAERLVRQYVEGYQEDLFRIWETERPFELHLDGIVVSGRADVILDGEGAPSGLAIVDYKTAGGSGGEHDLQLQIYAEAGRREGLDVRGAYVHDLKGEQRHSVDVSEAGIADAGERVKQILGRVRQRDYSASPGESCQRCDVRSLCPQQ